MLPISIAVLDQNAQILDALAIVKRRHVSQQENCSSPLGRAATSASLEMHSGGPSVPGLGLRDSATSSRWLIDDRDSNRYASLQTLVLFGLNNNKLHGPVSPALAADHAVALRLYGNFLSGTLPEALSGMTMLSQLDIKGNKIIRAIPRAVCCLRRLHDLKAGDNSLSEPFNTHICCLPPSLEVLQMYTNSLSGCLPVCLESLRALRNFWASENNLQGQFPEALRYITSLKTFYVESNQMRGALPDGLASLIDFRVTNNALVGAISDSWRNQLSIRCFHCGQNLLEGTIPSSFPHRGMVWLASFGLAGTDTHGSSSLHGTLPTTFARIGSIIALFLHYQQFQGAVPTFVATWRTLSLHSNLLQALPDLRFHPHARLLSHRNRLSCRIPTC